MNSIDCFQFFFIINEYCFLWNFKFNQLLIGLPFHQVIEGGEGVYIFMKIT